MAGAQGIAGYRRAVAVFVVVSATEPPFAGTHVLPPAVPTNPDFNVSAQHVQQPGQALDGATGGAAAHQIGDVRLGNAQQVGCLRLGQMARLDLRRDRNGQVRLCQPLFRIGESQVGEYVATALLDQNLLGPLPHAWALHFR